MRLPWSPVSGVTLPETLEAPSSVLPSTTTDDPRIGTLAGHALTAGDWPLVAIVGFPCDEGVRRNGGRAGARDAPDRIRELFYRLTPGPDARLVECIRRLLDFGNVRAADALEAAQQRLARVVGACLERGTIPIVLGGGHETAFGHFQGYALADRRVSILNWDAHPDVRPLRDARGHSGSPFRQALEDRSGACAHYTVAGLLPHAVSAAHLEFLAQHDTTIVWRNEITRERIVALYDRSDEGTGTAVSRMASFDLDAVDQAFAPGVSAPACGGITPDLWLDAALHAGRSPHVTSIDIVEMNPRYDEGDRTARLAALTVWTFLRGVSERRRGS
jgi:formiminoglutamase